MCFPVQIYHPNVDLEGVIDDGLRKIWKPQYDLNFCCYAWLNLFHNPNPLDPLNHRAAFKMRHDEREYASIVRRSLNGETINLDTQVDGETVKHDHKFPSKEQMNAVQPDPAWQQLFPQGVCDWGCGGKGC